MKKTGTIKLFDTDLELIPLDVLAKKLKIHIVTARRYVRTGKLKAQKIGRGYFVSRDNLKDFIDNTKQA